MIGAGPRRAVLSYGTFDGFTAEQVKRLKDLSHKGTELIIGCATDRMCPGAAQPFETRKSMLESCLYVDRVIAYTSASQIHTDVVNYDVSLLMIDPQLEHDLIGLGDLVQIKHLESAPTAQQTSTILQAVA